MQPHTHRFTPLTKEDVADVLGVSLRTIENWVASEVFPAPASIGGRVFWHPDVFYSWLDHRLRSGTRDAGSGAPRTAPASQTKNPPRSSERDRIRSQNLRRVRAIAAGAMAEVM